MSHIGSRAEYGLHCLLYLIGRTAAPAPSARDLAEFQGISPSYVAKLFTQLEKAGLVTSTEGIRGGFRLARSPQGITVLDVIDAVEGRKPLFECRDIRRNCVLFGDAPPPAAAIRGICRIHAIMCEAERAMRGTLARHTLADIAAGVASKVPAQFERATGAWFAERASARARRGADRKEGS